ncbi:Protein of unknown function [Pyronema omphalodes CBS 100304]|uniref:Uncharacterized protein n=1 Tax=Pyronema omphalodes (strain CBS 100304) TaxID=1076935 RepID=U4KYB8_PYROM|nr:Protein of unknown function [Pyronema omphalodes CBS 100304]
MHYAHKMSPNPDPIEIQNLEVRTGDLSNLLQGF